MSADRWVLCPACRRPNPHSADEPDSEYYGAMRVDWEIYNDDDGVLRLSIRLHCTECGASGEVKEDAINLTGGEAG